jgi:hypothetical protein
MIREGSGGRMGRTWETVIEPNPAFDLSPPAQRSLGRQSLGGQELSSYSLSSGIIALITPKLPGHFFGAVSCFDEIL